MITGGHHLLMTFHRQSLHMRGAVNDLDCSNHRLTPLWSKNIGTILSLRTA
jgi:hypothetical protein